MLTQRRGELLKTLVVEYIGSASPVASEVIAKKHSLGISSATIRNEMAELEEEGYLTRSHASAGAVPSDKAYRFYVETLPDVEELPRAFQYTIRYQFTNAERDMESWTRLASTVLAQLVSNVALVTYPRWPQSRVVRVDLVYIQEFLAFLILVLQEAKLRKQLLPLSDPLTGEDLQRVANRLSDTLGGLSRNEILSNSLELSPFENQVTEMILEIMGHEDQALYADYHIQGLRHLLGQPEFSVGGRAREIVEVLEDRELPKAVLAEAPEWGHLKVIIGEENRVTFLHPFSMVVCQYGLPGGGLGSISAIGPTRMEYARTIAGVRFISSLMTEMVAQVHG
ncbi:MAG: Heat-inducible transcription repressor HrcA [Dehalococcoidia bacterium]|nr:Heat-inducible transcription repressor HrcA [Dehalococcoidia bacterium]